MTCTFAYDDGAYILGALSPAERADFERHLPTCAQCRESVAALAVLPGLLGRLDSRTAVPSATAPVTLLPRLLAAAAARRHADRRRRAWASVAVALAAVMVAVTVGVGVYLANQRPTNQVAMTAMRQSNPKIPIDAEIGLSPADGGTWVAMRCRYADGYQGTWEVRLVVFAHTGESEQIGSWMATAGQELTLTALSHLAPDEIARVELQRADETTLLWWTPT